MEELRARCAGVRPAALRRVRAARLRAAARRGRRGCCSPSTTRSPPSWHAWAEERLREPFTWRLVHRGDLVAFLASHEETLRALDAVREDARRRPGDERRGIEDLSLKAIGDETSEVVRLVRSTLRDALKIGASDIHLETRRRRPGRSSSASTACSSQIKLIAGRGAGRAGDRAHQGAGRARHHRAARAAGRPLQGARARPRGRLPRLHHAEHPRRGRGAAHARQAVALREHAAAALARQPRLRGRATSARCAACRASPTACCW